MAHLNGLILSVQLDLYENGLEFLWRVGLNAEKIDGYDACQYDHNKNHEHVGDHRAYPVFYSNLTTSRENPKCNRDSI